MAAYRCRYVRACPDPAYGRGRRKAASTAAKITVVAPRPRPTVARIVRVRTGTRHRPRREIRRSCTNPETAARVACESPSQVLLTAIRSRRFEIAEPTERFAAEPPPATSPARSARAIRMSRCGLSSSSISEATLSGRRRRYQNRENRRPRSVASAKGPRIRYVSRSRTASTARAYRRQLVGLLTQALSAGGGERVVARAPVVVRRPPLGVDQALTIQPMERLIERGVLDGEVAVGAFVNQRRDAVAVHRPGGQDAQDQQVEGALQERKRFGGHSSP